MKEFNSMSFQQKLDTCSRLLSGRQLEPYVKKIVFSNYKNFSTNTTIEFQYPLTVLVGRNGTNKSSVLKALSACIDGTSLADLWFETDIDSIHSAGYWYTYDYEISKRRTVEAQVYLTKRKREGNLDYWETSAPSTAIGMQPYLSEDDPAFESLPNKTRWAKIDSAKKKSMYLSFRESLSSFDQFYYYGTYKWTFTLIKEKKEYIRTNSKVLSKVIAQNISDLDRYGKKRVFENVVLSREIVEKISIILGVDYDEIRLVKHNLFNNLGYTCHLKKHGLNYSEAFAGSGEFAVINMVNKIEQTRDKSLILIDEPEVSLHPEAQRKFLEYLIDKIITNKHQIVIATHSIELIKNLPPSAIKLIKLNEENKAIIERQYCLQDEAFQDLGVNDFNKHKIYVEDDVAELFLKIVLAKSTKLTPDLFEIIVFPGGDSRIYSAVVSSACISQSNKEHIFLDGDKDKQIDLLNPEQITTQMIDSGELDQNIIDFVGNISFLPCNSGGNNETNIDIKKNFLIWAQKNIAFLPSPELNPEQYLLRKKGIDLGRDGAKTYFIQKTKEKYPHLDAVALKNVLISEEIEALEMTDPDIIFIENCLLRFLGLL